MLTKQSFKDSDLIVFLTSNFALGHAGKCDQKRVNGETQKGNMIK
jgi:hypothetical protein